MKVGVRVGVDALMHGHGAAGHHRQLGCDLPQAGLALEARPVAWTRRCEEGSDDEESLAEVWVVGAPPNEGR